VRRCGLLDPESGSLWSLVVVRVSA